MQWFRARQFVSSHLALFALALQLVLSFGHIHLDDLGLGGALAATAEKASESGTPPGTAPDRDEGCAICAIIGLASTPLVPDAPALVFDAAQHAALFSELIAAFVSDPRREHFQARAPPV